jgi:hypothetical protein
LNKGDIMSKARAIADNSSIPPTSNLDGGVVGTIDDSNVYSTIESTGNYTFDGGTV